VYIDNERRSRINLSRCDAVGQQQGNASTKRVTYRDRQVGNALRWAHLSVNVFPQLVLSSFPH
jgi:hypothetical protein